MNQDGQPDTESAPVEDDLNTACLTAPKNIHVNLKGFQEEDRARSFGSTIVTIVRCISEWINLERLDGITVAFDYDAALAALDRGFPASRTLSRTNNERLVGVAMAPAVLRGQTVKGHLVFFAPIVLPLETPGTDEFRQALYLVAHECSHVADLRHRDSLFPGHILQTRLADAEAQILQPCADALWEEYAACRLSAPFGGDAQTSIMEECLVTCLEGCREKINEAIRKYRIHGDIDRVIEEAGNLICEPLRTAAYLLGHLDGLGIDLIEARRASTAIDGSDYINHLRNLAQILRDMWQNRDHWTSLEHNSLKDLTRDVLGEAGLVFTRLPNGQLYVDVPFTEETIPI